ncbi:MAG: 4-alpha-glucanotransferase [Ignavibacteria bacterium]|nr:4-alpha-glucanotransferase [Ignavibacteria bacterium]
MKFERSAGILLHPTSLPSKFGIGDLGPNAFRFIDFLHETKQKLWQILPLGPTSFGDSPYQCLSAFAGNPLLISLEKLVEEGFAPKELLEDTPEFPDDKVNYGDVIEYKFEALENIFSFFKKNLNPKFKEEFERFCETEKNWLEDYAFFVALKDYFDGKPWNEWEKEISQRKPEAIKYFLNNLKDEIEYHKFIQFIFFKQWLELKEYANSKGIKIIGDLPIFVAFDSADVWVHRDLFEVSESGEPLFIAGVPPDYFSPTGQRWGNPHYKWNEMKKDDYKWWRERIASLLKVTDIIRIDHFRGFYNYWKIPGNAPTAETGEWVLGPGEHFFSTLEKYFGKLPIIAEDLGILVPEVYELRDKFNFPGMKILQFAFGTNGEKKFLPHNHVKNCVVYSGSHDNDTTLGWWNSIQNDGTDTKEFFLTYSGSDGKDICKDMIRLAYSSVADIVIIPLQDFLRLGSEARMNFPGRPDGNWAWRFKWEQISDELKNEIKYFVEIFER